MRKVWGAAGVALLVLAAVGFWRQKEAAPANQPEIRVPAGYAQPGACAGCHAGIARTYALTGMSRSFGRMRNDSAFAEGTFQHVSSEQTFTMSRSGGKAHVKRHLTGQHGEPAEERTAEAQYWIGSGNRGRGFLHRTPSGRLLLLPVTYYAEEGGRWAMNPGNDRALHAGFNRTADHRCVSCHTAYPAISSGADRMASGWELPEALPEGIDCQRCHGPGQPHIDAMRAGQGPAKARETIVNPARLSAERRMEVCLQCHLETTSEQLPNEIVRFGRGVFSYRPGEPLGDWLLSFDYAKGSSHEDRFEFVSSAYRLEQSACFRKSAGKLTCTTCHNPHDIPRGEPAKRHYTDVCRSCHGAATLGAAHPAGTECVGCHMPKRTPSDAIHLQLADHFIRKRPEAPKRPEAEPAIAPYQGAVALYYPKAGITPADAELYTAVAQVTQRANLKQGTPALEAAVLRYKPEHGEFYLQLGNAWSNLNRPDKARRWLEEAHRRMPGDWRPMVVLAGALAAQGDAAGAERMLRQASATAPLETAPWIRLSELLLQTKGPTEAVEALRTASRIEPENGDIHNRLGAASLRMGDSASAMAAFREAVRLSPESIQARANLATLLALAGSTPEARHHFERVLRLDPRAVDARIAYAGLLAQTGDRANAVKEYNAIIGVNPNAFDAHLALGEIHIELNQTADARRHLMIAARSPDPEIAAEARQRLITLR